MPTYLYETIDEPHERFEIKQSMKDEPLKTHPQTGAPVRRIISGGFGYLPRSGSESASSSAPAMSGGGCGTGCGCC